MTTLRYAFLWGLLGYAFQFCFFLLLAVLGFVFNEIIPGIATATLQIVIVPPLIVAEIVGQLSGTTYCFKGGCPDQMPEHLVSLSLAIGLLVPYFSVFAIVGVTRRLMALGKSDVH